jgi:choline kinase
MVYNMFLSKFHMSPDVAGVMTDIVIDNNCIQQVLQQVRLLPFMLMKIVSGN